VVAATIAVTLGGVTTNELVQIVDIRGGSGGRAFAALLQGWLPVCRGWWAFGGGLLHSACGDSVCAAGSGLKFLIRQAKAPREILGLLLGSEREGSPASFLLFPNAYLRGTMKPNSSLPVKFMLTFQDMTVMVQRHEEVINQLKREIASLRAEFAQVSAPEAEAPAEPAPAEPAPAPTTRARSAK